MSASGWVHWHKEPPPDGVLIQVRRDHWPCALKGKAENFALADPWGLFWRLTGIGREQLEASRT